ncbi:MAG: acyl-CoA reductase [Thermoflavifilum sp.]|nr:acyl-CoA reductase [Thermoflavifilum sp.]
MVLDKKIDLLQKLGDYMLSHDAAWMHARERASQENPWFTPEFIDLAVHHIAEAYLNAEKLQEWLQPYTSLLSQSMSPRKIGLVMAGNIPMVGFHDLLCGWLSGHELWIKYASRDRVLIPFLVEKLKEWAGENLRIHDAELLRGCDAYIATGSQNTSRYFEYYFGKYPHIIRHNRTSVAILHGNESAAELQLLAKDICTYFGLGCRNVTKLYVPPGYDFQALGHALQAYAYFMDHRPYRHNFDYYLSAYLLNHQPHEVLGHIILKPDEALFSPVSVILYETYDNPEKLAQTLQASPAIQCLVGNEWLPFGKAQFPSLSDYADGINTLEFLLSLS